MYGPSVTYLSFVGKIVFLLYVLPFLVKYERVVKNK